MRFVLKLREYVGYPCEQGCSPRKRGDFWNSVEYATSCSNLCVFKRTGIWAKVR